MSRAENARMPWPDGRMVLSVSWWLLPVTLMAMTLAPLLVCDMPPLLDYPNHLARAYVLALAAADPVLSRMYQPHWAVIPNLALDILLPPLLHVAPVHVAGRLFLALTLLLPVGGVMLYHRVAHGGRSAWPALSCLVAGNGLFLLGFLNFQIGVGMAFAAAALWRHARTSRPVATVTGGTAAAALLFFLHLMGLALFLLLVATSELQRSWRAGAATRLRRAAAVVPLIVVPLALYAASAFGDEPGALEWAGARTQLLRILMPVIGYDVSLDLASAAVLAFVLARLRWSSDRAGGITLALLGLLAVVAPFGFKGTGYIDARFAVMGGFALFACLNPRRLPAWALAALLLVFAARTAETAWVWRAHAQDLVSLRAAIAGVAAGERVLPAVVDDGEAAGADDAARAMLARQHLSDGSRLDGHVAALLLIERHAFWPALFARTSQQPIRLRPPYDALAHSTGGIPNLRLLRADGSDPTDRAAFPLAGHWWCCYDAVLLIGAGAAPATAIPHLRQASDDPMTGSFARLYRVMR